MHLLLPAVVFIAHISSLAAQSCSPTSPCTPLKGGGEFKTLKCVRSQNGFLESSLVVDIANVQVDWLSTLRRLYNGALPGPTFCLKPGDKFTLNLVNNLTQPDFTDALMNEFRFPNTTNLHTHGLHISSKEPQDNVFISVGPQQNYLFQYEIDPDQPSGTYWYHPHNHGSTQFQVASGMVGMILIEDDPSSMPAELNAVSCPDHCENDLQIVFQIFQYTSAEEDGNFPAIQRDIHDYEGFRLNNVNITNSTQNLEQWLEDPTNNINYVLVNGQLQPKLTMQPGDMRRFRLLNSGGLYAYALQIVNTNTSGPSCDVKEIALDGVYLDKPRELRLGRSFIVASARVDWLVICPSPGNYVLRSLFEPEDEKSLGEHPSFNGTLLTIDVSGDTVPESSMPNTLPNLPSFLADLQNVSPDQIGGRYAIEVTPTDTLAREDYTESNIRYKAEVGTIQEYYLTNTEYVTSHPIHIHINHFQVISYNPYTGPYGVDDGGSNWKLYGQNGTTCTWQHSLYNAAIEIPSPTDPLQYLGHDLLSSAGGDGTIGYATIGEHRDVLLVPPLANITIRFMAHKYTGPVVVHCHLEGDADQGMMMTTEIVEKGASLEANITSAGAYPFSCFENNPIGQGNNGVPITFSRRALTFFCALVYILNL